jgi:hypothetical protein
MLFATKQKLKLSAVIIDSRKTQEIRETIDRHMDYLPGWDCEHISDVPFVDKYQFQLYLLNIDCWKRLQKYDKVLIFQNDSEILRKGVEEFLGYPYVGAPWKASFPGNTPDRRGGNGGISIRDVKEHLDALIRRKKRAEREWEDVWFSHNLPNVAPHEVCKKFSVESDFQLGSMCAHAIDKHLTPEQCHRVRTQYQLMEAK